MSFDPFGTNPQPEPPPSSPTPFAVPAAGVTNDGLIRERVLLPGMLLIATGVLNLIFAFGILLFGFGASRVSPQELEAQMAKEQPKRLEQMQELGWKVEDMMKYYVYGGYGAGVVVLLAALLAIVGGICILSLRGFGLAVFSSLVTAIPCISPMSCPCLIGMLIGFWCITLLLSPEVRASFR